MDNSVFWETGGSAKWANFFAPLLAEAMPAQSECCCSSSCLVRGSTKGANWFQ